MTRNPDPKPGRWVLPMVVLGMVLFTWIWVNRLGTADVDPTSPPTTPVVEATDPEPEEETEEQAPEETTPTTRIPPEIEVYLSNLADDKRALAELSAEMNAANQEWDDRVVAYRDAEEALVSVSEQALVFRTAVEDHRPPDVMPALVDAHQGSVLNSAITVATAAEDVLAGLRAPDDGELRRAALVEFRAAVAAFNQAVDQINDIIMQ